jgi:O-antigen ligase
VLLLNSAIALIQIVGQAEGMYGFIEPGKGPKWAPSLADALGAPGETALRLVGTGQNTPHAWALPRPDRPALLGTLMGGPGAHVALGALGLPLALGLALQLMSPGGSRDGFWPRLAESGQGSLLVLLVAATPAAAFLMGLLAGPAIAPAFAAGIVIVGIPSLIGTGVGWKGLVLIVMSLVSLGGGVWLGNAWPIVYPTAIELPRVDFSSARETWSAALAIVREFPLVGTGLGSFATIEPYYKVRDEASTTAMSSLVQWWVESGAVGLVLLGLAVVWGFAKLPRAIRRVGSADRALVFALVGAAACFATISCLHWTVELIAVAMAASAVAGTANRWLTGGTDLFVERGHAAA